jgi:hypothetical protein
MPDAGYSELAPRLGDPPGIVRAATARVARFLGGGSVAGVVRYSSPMAAGPPDLSTFPDGTPLSEIGAALGITVREARRRLVTLRPEPIPPRASADPRKRRTDPARDAEIVGRYQALETIQEIARAMQLSTMSVMSALDRYGVER